MAYSRDYNARINWENFPSTNTAVDADNLNKMDYAIFAHDQKIVELDGRVEAVKDSVSADVQTAKEYSDLSEEYALESKNFSETSSNEADRAYSEAERARMYADTVQEGITTTTSRELADSEPGGIRIISMDGESQQKQYSGKNLLPNTASTNTTKGITFTVNADKSITVKGTATGIVYLTVGKMKPIANQSYIFSHGVPWEDAVQCYLEGVDGGSNWITPRTFTPTTDTEFDCRIYIASGKTVNLTFKPMVRLASITDNTYEPYVGIASPNPNYPQSIDSVVVSEIRSNNKNILSPKFSGLNRTLNGITFTHNNDGKFHAKGTATANIEFAILGSTVKKIASVKAGTALIFSSTSNKCAFICSNVTGGSTLPWAEVVMNGEKRLTLRKDSDSTDWYIFIRISSGTTIDETVYPMVRLAEIEDSAWVPHEETEEELSAPIVLCGIGDVKDTVVKKDGVYDISRKQGYALFDGSPDEEWVSAETVVNGTTYYRYKISLQNANANLSRSLCLCNRAIYSVTSNEIGSCFIYGSQFFICTSHKTLEDFKTWLASNNIEVVYPLATPTFEPLPLADQIALHKLESFGGVTYLFTDSTIEPIIEVEYGTSKVGAYTIKSLNNSEISLLKQEQLEQLTNELATQIVAGSEA